MRFHLQNPNYRYKGNTSKERTIDSKLRNWTQNGFILQDNQIYRKGGVDAKGVAYNSKYTTCNSNTLDLI